MCGPARSTSCTIPRTSGRRDRQAPSPSRGGPTLAATRSSGRAVLEERLPRVGPGSQCRPARRTSPRPRSGGSVLASMSRGGSDLLAQRVHFRLGRPAACRLASDAAPSVPQPYQVVSDLVLPLAELARTRVVGINVCMRSSSRSTSVWSCRRSDGVAAVEVRKGGRRGQQEQEDQAHEPAFSSVPLPAIQGTPTRTGRAGGPRPHGH